MLTVDLITGFLGAGKTTFAKQYGDYFFKENEKTAFLENDFGAGGIDSAFLQDGSWDILPLTGGCICCSQKQRFSDTLQYLYDHGYTHAIVEPSGIYDADEFFSVLELPELKGQVQAGNVITIVDPESCRTLDEKARYLMVSQLAASGQALFSKTQLVSEETLSAAVSALRDMLTEYNCDPSILDTICTKDWDSLTSQDIAQFASCGHSRKAHSKANAAHADAYSSEVLGDYCESKENLIQSLHQLFSDTSCGTILRVKGFIRSLDGKCFEMNCSTLGFSVEECPMRSELISVIGKDLVRANIRKHFVSIAKAREILGENF